MSQRQILGEDLSHQPALQKAGAKLQLWERVYNDHFEVNEFETQGNGFMSSLDSHLTGKGLSQTQEITGLQLDTKLNPTTLNSQNVIYNQSLAPKEYFGDLTATSSTVSVHNLYHHFVNTCTASSYQSEKNNTSFLYDSFSEDPYFEPIFDDLPVSSFGDEIPNETSNETPNETSNFESSTQPVSEPPKSHDHSITTPPSDQQDTCNSPIIVKSEKPDPDYLPDEANLELESIGKREKKTRKNKRKAENQDEVIIAPTELNSYLSNFAVELGPYQSGEHVIRDTQDHFLKLNCNDQKFVKENFGEEALQKGERVVSIWLYDQEHPLLQQLAVSADSLRVTSRLTQNTITLKPVLPKLGKRSKVLKMVLEISLLYKNELKLYSVQHFSFGRFHHLKELEPEEFKKTHKKKRVKKQYNKKIIWNFWRT